MDKRTRDELIPMLLGLIVLPAALMGGAVLLYAGAMAAYCGTHACNQILGPLLLGAAVAVVLAAWVMERKRH